MKNWNGNCIVLIRHFNYTWICAITVSFWIRKSAFESPKFLFSDDEYDKIFVETKEDMEIMFEKVGKQLYIETVGIKTLKIKIIKNKF